MKPDLPSAAALVETYRNALLRAAASTDDFSAGLVESNSHILDHNTQADRAAEALNQIRTMGALHLLEPLLHDDNMLVRLWTAGALKKINPAEAWAVFVELTDVESRDFGYSEFGRYRIDNLAVSVRFEAEWGLWEMKTGSRDGFGSAPDRFWEQP